MEKKAIVFDNSGTLVNRLRVIKNLKTGEFNHNTNSLSLISKYKNLVLVVIQFNPMCLKKIDQEIKLYDLMKKHNIKFDISYSNEEITNEEVIDIIKNDSIQIKDITEGILELDKKTHNIDFCIGSAIILDSKKKKIDYTISSAGFLFPNTIKTIEILKNRGIDIFIASGDRSKVIEKLTEIFTLDKTHGFPTASSKRKEEIIQELQNKGYTVMMVGDGLNDVLAFEAANVSVLTLEQIEEVDKKLLNTTDYMIHDILEVTKIDF